MSARSSDCSEFWYWVPSATNASRNGTYNYNVRDSIVIFKVVLHFYLHYSNNDKNILFYLKSNLPALQYRYLSLFTCVILIKEIFYHRRCNRWYELEEGRIIRKDGGGEGNSECDFFFFWAKNVIFIANKFFSPGN